MFEQTWPGFAIAGVIQPLVEKAGVYAEALALRGYDSVQLAVAHLLHEQFTIPLTFACFDRRLNQAAQILQLEVLTWRPHIGEQAAIDRSAFRKEPGTD
ncbi:MAG: type II toxin-antitoxin system VapC family toxin [Cyanobacteriota bacterium]|jgi:hypothetical protein